MSTVVPVGFAGLGAYVPERRLTNSELEKIVDTTDEWIVQRTGIRERRVAAEGELTSQMGAKAAKAALDDAGIDAAEVDLIICCTFSPDVTVPCVACLVQERLGAAGKCLAFDLSAACTGFLYGLSVATAYMKAGTFNKALVIGALGAVQGFL